MIAAAANAAPNLVAVHFGNKEGLWLACVESLAQLLAPRFGALVALAENGEADLRDRLRTAIAMTASYYDQNPDLRGFIARGSLEAPPKARIIAERLLEPLFRAARPLIQQGIDSGMVPIADPALVFVILHAALGQPDRMASALAILSSQPPEGSVSARIGEAMALLLLQPAASDEGV